MRLLLIRHGETQNNVDQLLDTAPPGAPLTTRGEEQARVLANTLRDSPIRAIAVSDLIRTQQTAAPLATALGITPSVDPRLREIQAGDLELARAERWRDYLGTIAAWGDDPERRIPGGESGTEVLDRYDAAITDLTRAHPGADDLVAVVSHGAVIRTWLGHRARNLPPNFVVENRLDNTAVVELRVETGSPEPESAEPNGSARLRVEVLDWAGIVPRGADAPQT